MNVVKLPTANDRYDAKVAECSVEITVAIHAANLKYGSAVMLSALAANMAMQLRRVPPATRAVALAMLSRQSA